MQIVESGDFMSEKRYHSIRPGQVWLDTKGERIQAHGGSVMEWEGYYYWYGENKEFTDREKKFGTGASDATVHPTFITGKIWGLLFRPTPRTPIQVYIHHQ